MNNVTLEIYWDDTTATYRYRLANNGIVTTGDYEWANRIASHYGIEVPRAGEENETA